MTENEIVLDVLFHRFLNSIILRDTKYSKLYHTMILDLLKTDKECFKSLKKARLNYLKIILNDFENNTSTRSLNTQLLTFTPQHFDINMQIQDEAQLKKYLMTNKILEKSLNLTLISPEYPTSYGRVDMLYSKEFARIPCEVKLKRGEHDLITQIEKYMHHFLLLLNYKQWDYVQGITISDNYSDFAYKELKKLDVLMLRYKIINKTFYLETV